jgi:hypothetical protein
VLPLSSLSPKLKVIRDFEFSQNDRPLSSRPTEIAWNELTIGNKRKETVHTHLKKAKSPSSIAGN